jgi:diguanylate cyclase (GGDEF)-like protein/PAS domain S-box-containing protein
VHVTPAVEPIVGLPAPELLGMNWLDVVTDADRDSARDLVSLAQGGRPARGEVRLDSEDGHTRIVDAVVTEVIDEDLMGFVVTCHDITERHELEQQLTHQAFHDALTGLANRALFRDRLGHAMARARGAGGYAVLFIDLDDFKTVNDSLGHAAGDDLLREMTGRLRTCLRDGDTAARLGGDEFAILLEDVEDDDHCIVIARRLLEALAEPFVIGANEVTTGASIGIAVGQTGPASPEDLMRNADLALYDAKNAGKNRYAVFAPTMHEAALARLSLTSDLRHAIERNELVVHYQPLVDLESSKIIGLEALVRWNHPELGLLQPNKFISLAEETGLIVPLGRMVLQTALRETVRWQRDHEAHADLHIAVNVSGRQLQDAGIVDDVRLAIKATGIAASTVVLEITESVLLPGDGVIVERLHALAALGVHLYIDDFGTGYSSLSYLQMLPVNGLKLAQEFVETLPGTDTESGLVRTIKDLAGTLGLSAVIAEGIERPDQWTSLLSLGYSVGQGFHLAVPMPAERIPTFLSGLERPGEGDWERQVAAKEQADSALL